MNTSLARKGKKVAFVFTEAGPKSPAVLGGKGAGLVEMATSGVPVPPGFTVTTSVARAYAQHGTMPKRLAWQKDRGLASVEKATGKRFGDAANPLLLSVRSGAPVSMPGMMDTILNVGLTPAIVEGFGRLYGERFALDCYRRFLAMFGDVVLGVPRNAFESILGQVKGACGAVLDADMDADSLRVVVREFRSLIELTTGSPMVDEPAVQLAMAMEAVLKSWDNPRACEYRRLNNISRDMGTAINVQSMVFGNRDERSATGVVFSRNCVTGEPGIWGEFLVNAQGEDVVAGIRKTRCLKEMEEWNPAVYAELCSIVEKQDERLNFVADVEFTIESGKLYVLQVRKAKLTPEAACTVAVHLAWEKKLSKEAAVASVGESELNVVQADGFKPEALAAAVRANLVAQGLAASPGAAVGKVVYTSEAAVRAAARGEQVVLVRPDTSPDDLKGMVAAVAIVTETGGATSHAAVVARGLGKPCIVGCFAGNPDVNDPYARALREIERLGLKEGETVSVDGMTGVVVRGEVERVNVTRKKEVNIFLRWAEAAQGEKWAAPRLDFDLIRQTVSVQELISDFYLTDAMAEVAVGSVFAAEARRLKVEVHTEVAERLALYLCVAVGGEIRHAWRSSATEGQPEMTLLQSVYKIELHGDRNEAQIRALQRLERMSLNEQIRFADSVAKVFNNGGWGGSYGGRPWGQIAEALHGFLTGTPHTVFADHAFDLQHNGGCVFGKHRMIAADKRHEVKFMLDIKKRARSFSELRGQFAMYSTKVSPKVESLMNRLERSGVLKKDKLAAK